MRLNPPITAAVLTVSDRCWREEAEDTAGPALAELLKRALKAEIAARGCLPDEPRMIRHRLEHWAKRTPQSDLILTTGGTGIGPRDVTPEATAPLLQRRHPALLELARFRCYQKTPLACLSRGEAGTIGSTLVINLPGSERGATEMAQALVDVLPHAIRTLRGEGDADHPNPPSAKPATCDD